MMKCETGIYQGKREDMLLLAKPADLVQRTEPPLLPTMIPSRRAALNNILLIIEYCNEKQLLQTIAARSTTTLGSHAGPKQEGTGKNIAAAQHVTVLSVDLIQ